MKRHTCINCQRKRFEQNLLGFHFTTWITPVKQITTTHYCCQDIAPNNTKSCQMVLYSMSQNTKYFFYKL